MTPLLESALFLVIGALGAGAGFFGGTSAYAMAKRTRQRRIRRAREGTESLKSLLPGKVAGSGAVETAVINEMALATKRLKSGAAKPLIANRLGDSRWLQERLALAGLSNSVSSAGFWETRLKCAFAGAATGAAMGLSLSTPLGFGLLIVGGTCGWQLPKWAVASRIKLRAESMERHLGEMLDVLALGLRSGLSFERSLTLYLEHFDTSLARSFELAQHQWSCGFSTREEALRQVAASYDSSVMARVVEDMVRSLRFGSSLAENLEMAAAEVRASYRSKKEEQVAKAPVKMMVPTGALILPAMLILVLGPVLLELMEGF